MATVKYQGGPLDRKYYDVEQAGERIYIQFAEPRKIDWMKMPSVAEPAVIVKRGEYARSNKKLKNGIPIYVWLGWA